MNKKNHSFEPQDQSTSNVVVIDKNKIQSIRFLEEKSFFFFWFNLLEFYDYNKYLDKMPYRNEMLKPSYIATSSTKRNKSNYIN